MGGWSTCRLNRLCRWAGRIAWGVRSVGRMGWSDQMIEPASWVGPLEQGLTMYVTTCPRHHGQAGVKIIEGTFTPSIIVREIDPETDPHFRGPSLADV